MKNSRIHHYEILDEIGIGDFSVVVLGKDTITQEFVAIKIFDKKVANDPIFRESQIRGINVLAKLQHPNIVEIKEIVDTPDVFAFVMEYVDSITLDDFIYKNYDPKEPLRLLPFFYQILDGIEYAHSMGIVHRALNPQNILVAKTGEVKIIAFHMVTNFGFTVDLAIHTLSTGDYISPEYFINSQSIVKESDIYSLGIILFYLLTGEQLIFFAEKVKTESLPLVSLLNPNIPSIFNKILAKATEKSPKNRFQSCFDFKNHVEKKLDPNQVVSQPEPQLLTQNGTVCTFYSFKGGVGRSMAMANIGVLLAQWNYKVLMIDWDFEAPGLEYYFKDYVNIDAIKHKTGMIDILSSHKTDNVVEWDKCVTKIQINTSTNNLVNENNLGLITSGKKDESYFERIQNFDYVDFYQSKSGGKYIETLRNKWKEEYDFILIDSRTGVSDNGGICTVQLPDILVMFFTATEQGLAGTLNIGMNIEKALNKLPVDRYGVLKLPIPSRFDMRSENKIAHAWLNKFSIELLPMVEDWFSEDNCTAESLKTFYSQIFIPSVPIYSFGERLPVVDEGTNIKDSIGFSYETIAALLANKLENVDNIESNRERIIKEAIQKKIFQQLDEIDVFLSHKSGDNHLAIKISDYLTSKGLKVFNPDHFLISADYSNLIDEALTKSKHLIVIGSSVEYITSSWVEAEWRFFLNRKRSGKTNGNLITVVTEDVKIGDLPPSLQNYEVIVFDENNFEKILNYVGNFQANNVSIFSIVQAADENINKRNYEVANELLLSALDLAILKKDVLQEYFISLRLAKLGLDSGKNEFAYLYFEKAFNLYRENLPVDHPSAVQLTVNFASLLQKKGTKQDLLKAKSILDLTLYDEFAIGNGNNETSINIYKTNLASILKELGGEDNLLEAKFLLENVLAFNTIKMGENDSQTVLTMKNLANICIDLGGISNLEIAKKHLEKVLEIELEKLNTVSPSIIQIYTSLTVVLINLGGKPNLLMAKDYAERVLKQNTKIYGASHQLVATNQGTLAIILVELEGKTNLSEAEKLFKKAIEINLSNYGYEHESTLKYCYGLALTHWKAKEIDKSVEIINKIYPIAEKILSPKNTTFIDILGVYQKFESKTF